MRTTRLTFPELGIIAATRGMLGIGVGLLLGDRFEKAPRRAVGWTLLTIGALSTVPLMLDAFGKSEKSQTNGTACKSRSEQEMIKTTL